MEKRRNWNMTKKQENIFNNLWKQAERVFDWRTHHQGKRGTERYRAGVRAFCRHLAIVYQPKNFKNISDKHIKSFVKASQEAGVGAATIKTDIAAIKKLHLLLPKKRYQQLSADYSMLGAEKRQTREVDRAWSNEEVTKAYMLTRRKDINWAIRFGRTMGLRLEEVTALTRTQLRYAKRSGYLTLTTTKGGIKRDIPLTPISRRLIINILETDTNEKIFLRHGRTHLQAMRSIQNWIINHRDKFTSQSEEGGNKQQKLTFHGLRHAFARSKFNELITNGIEYKQALKEVAALLGHGRDQVTLIYLNKDMAEQARNSNNKHQNNK